MEKKASLWSFGARQAIYGVFGAALYGIFSWATNMFPFLSLGSIAFDPSIAVLIFFGIAYGPWAGLIAGLAGAALGDGLSGWGVFWNRSLVGAIIGFIPGIAMLMIRDDRSWRGIGIGIGFGAIGILVGLLVYAISEMMIGGLDLNAALGRYLVPDLIGNLVMTAVVLPALLWAFPSPAAKKAG